MSQDLIARLLARRERWLELGQGKAVRLRRPAECEFAAVLRGMAVERIAACVTEWRGFTEADLLGPQHGSTASVAFAADLWAEVLRDNAEWFGLIVEGIAEDVRRHTEARGSAEKN